MFEELADIEIKDRGQDRYPSDHKLWMVLLTRAATVSDELYGILDWLRATGTILLHDDKFKYRLSPLVGHGCWQTEAEYKQEAKALVPYKALLVKLLGRLP